MLKSVDIKAMPSKAHIKLDGQEINGVTEIGYFQSVKETIPEVILKMSTIANNVNLEFERADVKVWFKDNWIPVERLMPEEGESVLALVKEKDELHQEVLTNQYFEETDAMYAGHYWCSYRTINIEALGRCKVIAWQPLPGTGDYV